MPVDGCVEKLINQFETCSLEPNNAKRKKRVTFQDGVNYPLENTSRDLISNPRQPGRFSLENFIVRQLKEFDVRKHDLLYPVQEEEDCVGIKDRLSEINLEIRIKANPAQIQALKKRNCESDKLLLKFIEESVNELEKERESILEKINLINQKENKHRNYIIITLDKMLDLRASADHEMTEKIRDLIKTNLFFATLVNVYDSLNPVDQKEEELPIINKISAWLKSNQTLFDIKEARNKYLPFSTITTT